MDQVLTADVGTTPEAAMWLRRIAAYNKKFEKWLKRAEQIEKRYRDYDENDGGKKAGADFNVLWSNVQVLLPATFARLPKPDVSRRWRDNDPVGRVAALLLERALSFEIEHYPDYGAAMKACVLDRFLGGRGTAWVRYEPHFQRAGGAAQITEDADESDTEQEQEEELAYECAPVDYVHYKDFGHVVARTWAEVPAIWRGVYMGRPKLVERFGAAGRKVPLDSRPDQENGKPASTDEAESMAYVYEIWDKSSSEVIWMTKAGVILDRRHDPLELDNFWPCPEPLFATLTNSSLIPVPDYKLYQDQAKQLDKLATKIDGLIDMLVVKGVHDAAVPELARLFKEAGNGDLIPVKNFQAFAEKNGLAGSIDIYDITPIVTALNEAYAAQERVENSIYQLVGVSDIQRGASDPTETYGAQKLKGQYGNMRLRNRQDEVVQFATSLLKLKAQVICQQFQAQTLVRISAADQLMPEDQQLVPQALQLLMGARAMDPQAQTVDGPLAAFRVEVTSDSMIQVDDQQEKTEGMEFIGAVSTFLKDAIPAVQQTPQLAPLAVGLLKFGITRFKVGKTIEGMLDQMLDQMVKQAAQPQPPKPDPELQKIEAQMQLEDKKLANAQALAQQKAQADAALAANEQQVQAQQNAHQNMLESQRAQQQAQIDAALEQQRMQFDAMLAERDGTNERALEELRGHFELLKAAMDNANRLEVAEVAAQTTLEAAQVSAARAATEGEQ